ncbi:MAG: hypothetical protein KQH63_13215 [Desulfobulbaceae bacterium]|nr:hypothetical protein [Desulfobulbaceae bacterium]
MIDFDSFKQFLSGMSDLSTPILVFIIAVLSILNFLDSQGIKVPKYSKFKFNSEKDRIKNYLQEIYDNEYEFLKENEAWRIDLLLKQLNLHPSQKRLVEKELRKLSRSPIDTKEERENALRSYCKNKLICINTNGKDNLTYKEVKYFLNFFDIMSHGLWRSNISQLMANHIKDELKKLLDINKFCIVVPRRGNFLFGYEVSKALNVPVVFMRNEGRIQENKPWDGSFNRFDNVVIIHDVTVTGKQIVEDLYNLTGKNVIGLFTLVLRTDKNAFVELSSHNVKVFPVLKFDEESLRYLVET